MGLAGAVLGAGAISGVTGLIGSSMQADAANHAADVQYQASVDAANRLQPFTDVGKQAIPTINGLLGIGTAGPGGLPDPAAINSFLSHTPGYQFTKQQGLESVQNGFAAQGLARSGAAIKGAEGFATGLASQTYQNVLGNYTNLLANSQSAAAGQGGALIGGANAQASGIIGSANAISNGLTGFGNSAGNTAINYAALQGISQANGLAAGAQAYDSSNVALFGGG